MQIEITPPQIGKTLPEISGGVMGLEIGRGKITQYRVVARVVGVIERE